ncbi:MAG: hypothetical protein L0Y66_23785 [Myxococcaceae bacterium]|nr:hypothetical protein [Myxococcaceae bacterium]
MTLPYSGAQAAPDVFLFNIENTGTSAGGAVLAKSSSTASSTFALEGLIDSTTPGGFSAGVRGINNGTGGLGIGVWGSQEGSGWGVYGVTPSGIGVYGNSSDSGVGVWANSNSGTGLTASSNAGSAAKLNIFNTANNNPALTVSTVGNGTAGSFIVDRTTGTSPAVKGEVNSQFSNFGTAGIYGVSSGTGGFAGLFHASNPSGNGPALIAIAEGTGNGITANASNSGDGVETTADGTGNALYAWTPNFSNGRAARLVNFNSSNPNPVLTVETHSTTGSIAVFKSGTPGTVNVARIDRTGRGFFNNGTQVGGADLAEFVSFKGALPQPGDVVEIDPEHADHFRLASAANSTRVAGVISTTPGVTLNAKNGANEEVSGPALALAGRVPVKVTAEGGAIRIGDLLVASSTPGHAMRAPENPKVGTVIGKAMQNLREPRGTVEMLVMLR